VSIDDSIVTRRLPSRGDKSGSRPTTTVNIVKELVMSSDQKARFPALQRGPWQKVFRIAKLFLARRRHYGSKDFGAHEPVIAIRRGAVCACGS
jgi:hypothetical protein